MSTRKAPLLSRGFSLIEILVALVIGTLAIISVMQVASLSEKNKRTTTGGADAQTTGTIAYYQMARDIRVAGYGLAANALDYSGAGLSGGILAQCTSVSAFYSQRDLVSGTPVTNYSYVNSTFAPAVINPKDAAGGLIYPAGDDNSDVILINYSGSSGDVGGAVPVITNLAGTTSQPMDGTGAVALADFQADAGFSRVGFHQGDLYLAVPATGGSCVLGEITGLPVISGDFDECGQNTNFGASANAQLLLNHNVAEQYLSYEKGCTRVTAERNSAAAPLDPTLLSGSKLYNMGPVGALGSKVYTVRFCATTGCALAVCDMSYFDCTNRGLKDNPAVWSPLGVGVVALHAQYGLDAAVPPAAWTHTVGAWKNGDSVLNQPSGANWQRLLAIRLALVVRSNQYEKPSSGSVCDTTTTTKNPPTWEADHPLATTTTIDVSGSSTVSSTEWQCYRYNVVQTLETMRNMVWGQ
jgi:type IV pilus assembly protein PilW